MGYRFTDLVDACRDDWHAYIAHDFVLALGRGELADASFRHYLKQDYLFLLQFSRAYALAAYKSHSLDELRGAFDGMKTILDVELGLHLAFCRDWGIGEAELSELPEARATLAYTRYVLDAGSRGDLLDLHVALAPCLVGYGAIAKVSPPRLRRYRTKPQRPPGHPARCRQPLRRLDRHVRKRRLPGRSAPGASLARRSACPGIRRALRATVTDLRRRDTTRDRLLADGARSKRLTQSAPRLTGGRQRRLRSCSAWEPLNLIWG